MTKIQWTEKTWNPIRGCSIVSPGCVNCYAMKMAHRFSGPGMPYEGLTVLKSHGPTWTGKVVCDEKKLDDPLHWKKPCRIFVNSMSDLFHESVPFEFIDKVFLTMMLARRHTYQILTKRPARMRDYCASNETLKRISSFWSGLVADNPGCEYHMSHRDDGLSGFQLDNVWLGVSVEDQKTADERIPLLLQTPAAVRWVSYEPALEYVEFYGLGMPVIDWIVVGGESGPGARPFDTLWAWKVIATCREFGTACFVKQLGSEPIGLQQPLSDRKGGVMAEWPEDLRVREYPR